MSDGILVVALAKRFGGSSVRVIELARRLEGQRRYAVAVLAGSELHRRLADEGLGVRPLTLSRATPRLVPALGAIIRRERVGVVDAHNVQSQLWGTLAGIASNRGPRRVTTVHSTYREEHRGARRGGAYEGVLRLNHRLGSRFVAVSESVARYLASLGIPGDRVSIIENGVAAPAAGLAPVDRADFGFAPDHTVVAVVARLEPVKGHRFLIAGLRMAAARRPELRVLVVGDGRARARLEALAAAEGVAGRIHFAGFRSDVARILLGVDAFCLPSLSEGLPFALLEACATGLPVLATTVGAPPTFLTDEHTAHLVPPGDAAALAERLVRLSADRADATRMGRAGREVVLARFSLDRMMERTLAVYARGAADLT